MATVVGLAVVGFVLVGFVLRADPRLVEVDSRLPRDGKGAGAMVKEGVVVLAAAELLADMDAVRGPASPPFDVQPAIIAAAVSAAASAGMRFIGPIFPLSRVHRTLSPMRQIYAQRNPPGLAPPNISSPLLILFTLQQDS